MSGATAAERQWFLVVRTQGLAREEAMLLPRLADAIAEAGARIAEIAARGGSPDAIRAAVDAAAARRVLVAHMMRIGEQAAAHQTERLAQLTAKNATYIEAVRSRLRAIAEGRAVFLDAALGRTVGGVLLEAADAGWGSERTAAAIRDATSGELGLRVARRIVRTEMHWAQQFGADAAAEETGLLLEKEWMATEDDRTRPSHAAADGQRVPMDGKFTVGGQEMKVPGDPAGGPAETVNCRCQVFYHPATAQPESAPGAALSAAPAKPAPGNLDRVRDWRRPDQAVRNPRGLRRNTEQGHAAVIYTGDGSKAMNQLMQGRDAPAFVTPNSSDPNDGRMPTSRANELLSEALRGGRVTRDGVLYSGLAGMGRSGSEIDRIGQLLSTGSLPASQFTSTSTRQVIAVDFADQHVGRRAMLLRIFVRRGNNALAVTDEITSGHSEAEVILPPGAFRLLRDRGVKQGPSGPIHNFDVEWIPGAGYKSLMAVTDALVLDVTLDDALRRWRGDLAALHPARAPESDDDPVSGANPKHPPRFGWDFDRKRLIGSWRVYEDRAAGSVAMARTEGFLEAHVIDFLVAVAAGRCDRRSDLARRAWLSYRAAHWNGEPESFDHVICTPETLAAAGLT